MQDVKATIVDSNVYGGLDITQSCSVDGQCMIGSVSDATTDVFLKAKNSSAAAGGAGLFNISDASGRMNIQEKITQQTMEKCDIESSNQMDDISIYAAGSNIYGGIAVAQTNTATGGCVLNNQLDATAKITGTLDNKASSGKAVKMGKFESKSRAVMYAVIGIVAVVVLVFLLIIAKMFSGGGESSNEKLAQMFAPPTNVQPRAPRAPTLPPINITIPGLEGLIKKGK